MIKKFSGSRVLGFLLIGVVMTQLFQNCGQLGSFDVLDEGVFVGASMIQDTQHPAAKPVDPPKQKLLVVNRKYVEELLRDVFTSATYPVPALESKIFTWVTNRPSQYGGGCDPYGSWTAYDCGGSISAVNAPHNAEDSSLRAAYLSQACENLLGADNGVHAVLEKISRKATAPNAESIAEIYDLFYRGTPPTSAEVSSLLDLDRSLVKSGEIPLERWRAVILQVCQSPAWQLQ